MNTSLPELATSSPKKPYYTPARCSAEIPVSPFDGEVCGALGDIVLQEGVRCSACADEFGGTCLDGTPYVVGGAL